MQVLVQDGVKRELERDKVLEWVEEMAARLRVQRIEVSKPYLLSVPKYLEPVLKPMFPDGNPDVVVAGR